jgi:integrase
MYDKTKDLQEQALLSCLWITGARPSEILELAKKNVLITDEVVVFDLPTKKLQADGTRFVMKRRQLRIGRPHGLQMNIFLETVVKYAERLYHPEDPIFIYGRRWAIKVINRLGMQAIGKEVAPYHLRHSAVTREASQGRTLDQLKHFKGAKSIRSVEPYLHASPYDVMVSSEAKPIPVSPTPITDGIKEQFEEWKKGSRANLDPYLPAKPTPAPKKDAQDQGKAD